MTFIGNQYTIATNETEAVDKTTENTESTLNSKEATEMVAPEETEMVN